MGVEASWLLPAALIGLLAGLWFTRRTARTAPVRAGLLLWGGWLLVTGAVFSFMDGTVHPYYTVELAPAIAAVVGISVSELWRGKEYLTPRIVMAVMAAATGVWAYVLLDRTPDWTPWLRWVVLVGSVVVAAVLAVGAHRLGRCRGRTGDRRSTFRPGRAHRVFDLQRGSFTQRTGHDVRARPRRRASAVAGPAAPAAPTGGPGGRGPGGGEADNAALAQLIEGADNRWAAASVGSFTVSSLELKTGASLMAIGGFTGSDNSPTLAQFQAYVADHQVRYFIGSDRGGPVTAGRDLRRRSRHGCSRTSPRSTSAARPSTTSANPVDTSTITKGTPGSRCSDTARPITRPPCFPRAGRPCAIYSR